MHQPITAQLGRFPAMDDSTAPFVWTKVTEDSSPKTTTKHFNRLLCSV
jgi:hypothetical protein